MSDKPINIYFAPEELASSNASGLDDDRTYAITAPTPTPFVTDLDAHTFLS